MATKRVDPLKAKEAKQKKIAIGGAVLLVALIAFQGPKTMKMLQGPQPVTTPVATTAAPAPTTPGTAPVTGGTAAGGAPTTDAPVAELASVPDSDPAPDGEQGQLATFERFASKDPFAQQAEAVAAPAPAPAEADEPAEPAKEEVEKTPTTGGFTNGGSGSDPPVGSGTPSGSGSPGAAPVVTATASVIAVNGVSHAVDVDAEFPADEPTFLLVSEAKNGKSVELGIAGGSYADGGETMTLKLGKTLTLRNTADGTRYVLELIAVDGFPVSKANQERLPETPDTAPAPQP